MEFLVVIVRIAILISLILLMIGVTIPGFIFNRFGIQKAISQNRSAA